jgi:hypothetical protein
MLHGHTQGIIQTQTLMTKERQEVERRGRLLTTTVRGKSTKHSEERRTYKIRGIDI